MTDQPLTTRPPDAYEKKLREKYAESFASQGDLMDKLAQQLLTLELAIPGLYATVLKLIRGDKATVPVNNVLYVTFALWIVALGLTLAALMPRKWKVNPTIMERDPKSTTGELGIKDFFAESARYKRNLLIAATILFFFGITLAALTVS
jgi:hypothetical protein